MQFHSFALISFLFMATCAFSAPILPSIDYPGISYDDIIAKLVSLFNPDGTISHVYAGKRSYSPPDTKIRPSLNNMDVHTNQDNTPSNDEIKLARSIMARPDMEGENVNVAGGSMSGYQNEVDMVTGQVQQDTSPSSNVGIKLTRRTMVHPDMEGGNVNLAGTSMSGYLNEVGMVTGQAGQVQQDSSPASNVGIKLTRRIMARPDIEGGNVNLAAASMPGYQNESDMVAGQVQQDNNTPSNDEIKLTQGTMAHSDMEGDNVKLAAASTPGYQIKTDRAAGQNSVVVN